MNPSSRESGLVSTKPGALQSGENAQVQEEASGMGDGTCGVSAVLRLTRQYKATRFTDGCPPLERSLLGAQNGRRALPRAPAPLKWYYRPAWVVVLLFVVLGPL